MIAIDSTDLCSFPALASLKERHNWANFYSVPQQLTSAKSLIECSLITSGYNLLFVSDVGPKWDLQFLRPGPRLAALGSGRGRRPLAYPSRCF
jgi:hypothetical protein